MGAEPMIHVQEWDPAVVWCLAGVAHRLLVSEDALNALEGVVRVRSMAQSLVCLAVHTRGAPIEQLVLHPATCHVDSFVLRDPSTARSDVQQ